MQYLPHQLLMIEDGFPVQLFKTKAERQAWWDANPPKFHTYQDPRLEAELQLRAQQKKEATAQRIARMQNQLNKKKLQKIDYFGLRWDWIKGRYIDDENKGFRYPPTQEKNNMDRLAITPFNAKGEIVARGVTSVKADATPEQIDAQITHAVKRGGVTRVVRVEVKDTTGATIKEWTAAAEVVTAATAQLASEEASADAAPATGDQPNAGQAEEAGMVKKSKKASKAKVRGKKVKATKKAKVAGKIKSGSKTEIVAKLLQRASGCTKEDILRATGWKAVGVMQQAKVCGLKVKKLKEKGKPTRYFVK
jgi:hypothetical protein